MQIRSVKCKACGRPPIVKVSEGIASFAAVWQCGSGCFVAMITGVPEGPPESAEPAALRKDAERYRKLRDKGAALGLRGIFNLMPSEWDKAIDAR